MLSGALMDFSLNEKGANEAQIDRLSNVFGLYHSCYLVAIVVCRHHFCPAQFIICQSRDLCGIDV